MATIQMTVDSILFGNNDFEALENLIPNPPMSRLIPVRPGAAPCTQRSASGTMVPGIPRPGHGFSGPGLRPGQSFLCGRGT